MPLEAGHQRLDLGEQFPPLRHRERTDDTHASQPARVVVQAEQQ